MYFSTNTTVAPTDRFHINKLLSSEPPARAHIVFRAATPAGFDISLWVDEVGVRACIGGLEHDFETMAEAAPWVRRALSSDYQLTITMRGKCGVMWVLAPVNGNGPELASARISLLGKWAKTTEIVRRNCVLG